MRSSSTIIAVAWLAFIAATASPFPVCNRESAGVVTCMSGKLCECGFSQPSRSTGQPGGFQWDCGVLRPACWDAQPDATLQGWQGQIPSMLSIERPAPPRGYGYDHGRPPVPPGYGHQPPGWYPDGDRPWPRPPRDPYRD